MSSILLAILVLGVLGGIFGAVLAVASKIYVEVDPKQEAIRACLAGANCGGCGYPGCDGYAAAVAAGEAPTNRCVAGGAECAEKVARIMGVEAGAAEPMVAFVPCSGTEGHAEKRFNYNGPKDCQAAMLFGGKSNKTCTFACIGLGNCVKACQFGAMEIVDGIAKVNGPSALAAAPVPMPAPRAL
ncbi:MAG: RnfABCDGE type electron transport complex subunit B [Oscillospiraceae bacterium]